MTMSHFVKKGSAAMAALQPERTAASNRAGSTAVCVSTAGSQQKKRIQVGNVPLMSDSSEKAFFWVSSSACAAVAPFFAAAEKTGVLGHQGAAVRASRSSRSSVTPTEASWAADERLHNDIENPGALSEVSRAPVRMRDGLMPHFESARHCQRQNDRAFVRHR